MTGVYRFADKNIKIESVYDDVHKYCKEYISNGEPNFTVITTINDIEYEKKRSASNDIYEGKPVVEYNDGYLEELAVYRKIAEKMPEYDTFLFHGSAVAVDGQAYLFTAKSGTGKSTHTRLWRELLGDRAVMVNDDKPLIRIDDDKATVFGTPYNGKHDLGCNMSAPLKAICIIERGEKNSIERISKSDAYPMLLQQVYRPSDGEAMSRTLGLIDLACERIGLYRLKANMDISAAELSFKTMSK